MNQSNYWCNTADIDVNEIDRRALEVMQNGQFPTLVYISSDLYIELQKSMISNMKYSFPQQSTAKSQQPLQNIVSINTSAGALNFQRVRRLRNFLMVGRKEDFDAFTNAGIDPIFWNDQEIVRIDKAFEDLIILEGENG